MFKNWKKKAKELENKAEELSYCKEEYDFLHECNEKRMYTARIKRCKHNKKIYLKHLPLNQMWIMLCDDCGYFSAIMCGHGGSGYMCRECIPKLAKEVIML